MSEFQINTKIRNKQNPDWGVWRITKVPTPKEDWYEMWGDSGARVLDKWEAGEFWEVVV